MNGLPTGTFALSDYPRAPAFPSNLGEVQAIDPDKVYADVAKGMAQTNALASNPASQGALLATLGEAQDTANVDRSLLRPLAEARLAGGQAQTAQARLAVQQAGAAGQLLPGQTALAATKTAGEQTVGVNQNQLAAQGYEALKSFPDKLSAIAQTVDAQNNPDYARQYQLYSQLQANSPWLNHPAFKGENDLVSNERAQALGVLQARAKQQADLLRTQTVVGGRENVAQTVVGGKEQVAGTQAAARQASSSNPLIRANQAFAGAMDDLQAAQSGGDEQEIAAAQEALQQAAEFRRVAEQSALRRPTGGAGASGGRVPLAAGASQATRTAGAISPDTEMPPPLAGGVPVSAPALSARPVPLAQPNATLAPAPDGPPTPLSQPPRRSDDESVTVPSLLSQPPTAYIP
jgi:hypothetical protein